jgi:hypothetical protein
MSTIVSDPLLYVWEKPVVVCTATTIARLAFICGAATLCFTATTALLNARRCISKTIERNTNARRYLQDYVYEIDESLNDLAEREVPDASHVLGFLSGDTPWIKLISKLPILASDDLLESIGSALCIALLTNTKASRQRGKRLFALANAVLKHPRFTTSQAKELDILLTRGRSELTETLAMRQSTDDVRLLQFSAALLVHLRSDLNSLHQSKQQAANLRTFLSHEALSQTVIDLHEAIVAGDLHALISSVSLALHLREELVWEIPIYRGAAPGGAVMWFDASASVFYVRLTQLLADLGTAVEGGVETADTLKLHLPDSLGQTLQTAIAVRPQAYRLGDLLEGKPVEANLAQLRLQSDRARLARSAPAVAIRLIPNRVICAYAFLAFHLLTKADLHYLTISQAAVDEYRSEFFEKTGWGPTTLTTSADLYVGSKRTPGAALMKSLFIELDQALEQSRVGKRYKLGGLIEHHNAFCRRVACFLQFVAGARGSHSLKFNAGSWFAGSHFGYLDDKDAGTAGGRTPVPISPLTSLQLRYWESHLRSLAGRLSKIGDGSALSSIGCITSILEHRDTPIFFLMASDGSAIPASARDIFQPIATKLTRDFGRHFMASSLSAKGHTLGDIHAFLRHQGGGVNPQNSHGVEVHHDRLLRTALAVDAVLNDLNITPRVGLSKGDR